MITNNHSKNKVSITKKLRHSFKSLANEHYVSERWEEHFNELFDEIDFGYSKQLKAISDLEDFCFEVCPLHREDDLHEIINRL